MKYLNLLNIILFLFLCACGGKGTIDREYVFEGNIDSFKVENNLFTIEGSHLEHITNLEIFGKDYNGNDYYRSLTVESNTGTTIVAHTDIHIYFVFGDEYTLRLSNQYGSKTVQIKVEIADGSVTSGKFYGTVYKNQILRFNGNYWRIDDFMGLIYLGHWSPSSNSPNLNSEENQGVGRYYIVNNDYNGNHLISTNEATWGANSWVMWNAKDSLWEEVTNGTSLTSYNERSGEIVQQNNDCHWSHIDRTNSSIGDTKDVNIAGTPGADEVLSWNDVSSKWEPFDITIEEGEITSNIIEDNSVESTHVANNTIVDEDITSGAGIPYTKLNILDNEIPAVKVDNLIELIDISVNTAGEVIYGDLDMGGNKITNIGTINGFDIFALNSSAAGNYSYFQTVGGGVFVTNVTASHPIISSQGATPNLTITAATAATDGYLTSVDWNTFNDKQVAIEPTVDLTMGSLTSTTQGGVVISSSSSTSTGELRFMETEDSNFVALRAPTTILSSLTLTMPDTEGNSGETLTTDSSGNLYWGNIATRGASVIDVFGVTPISTSGTSTINIEMTPSSSATSGYLTNTDWDIFNQKMDLIESSTALDTRSVTTYGQNGIIIGRYGENAGETGEVRFMEKSGGDYVGFKAPDILTSNIISTLPSSDGSSGQALMTDGNGTLTWTTILVNNSITSSKLTSMGATPNQFLRWDGSDWNPEDLYGLTYKGEWDASSGSAPSPARGGYYFIVSKAGMTDLSGGVGTDRWEVSDWAIYNAELNRWEKIRNSDKGVQFLTVVHPIVKTVGYNPVISIPEATEGIDGYLSTTGWNTFNDKQDLIDEDSDLIMSSLTSNSQNGITVGKYTGGSGELRFKESLDSDYVAIKSPATVSAAYTWILPETDGNANEVLIKGSGDSLQWIEASPPTASVTSVSGIAPIAVTRTTNYIVSIPAATSSTSGYLKSTDWVEFNGKEDEIDDGTDLELNSFTSTAQIGVTVGPYGGGSGTGEIYFKDLAKDNYIGFRAPDNLSGDTVWFLPEVDGLSGDVLTTNGSGVLTWSEPIEDDSITSDMLSDMGASADQFLSWDSGSWAPTSIEELTYKGTWDASSGLPPSPTGGGFYYIVTAAGDTDLNGGAGTNEPWGINDWAIYNSDLSQWEKISNSIQGVVTVSGNLPVTSSGGLTPNLSIDEADSSTDGYLSSDDWDTFNEKQDEVTSGTNLTLNSLTTNDQDGVVIGPYNDGSSKAGKLRFMEAVGSDYVALRAPTTIASNIIWTLPSDNGSNGQVLATDGNKNLIWYDGVDASQVVNSVSAEGPVLSSGGVTPVISIALADSTTSGYLISTDWEIFSAKQDLIDSSSNITIESLTSNAQNGIVVGLYFDGSTLGGELRLNEVDQSNYVSLQAPATLGGNIVWTLPDSEGTSGHGLSSDGSGNFEWIEFSTPGGVINEVVADNPVSSTGGNNPIISISQANSSGPGYLSTAHWSMFSSKQATIATGPIDRYLKGDLSLGVFADDVLASLVTSFSSTTGTVSATDTVISAINKLNGNISNKEASFAAGSVGEYFRGDKNWVALDTDAVIEADNKYYSVTTARTDLVTSSVTNGTTDMAPSSDAVFDDLALKINISDKLTTVLSLATDAGNVIIGDDSNWTVEQTGTGADDLVRLDASGRLPALDGRNLSSISPGTTASSMFINSNYNVLVSDIGKTLLTTSGAIVTLPSPATASNGFILTVKNIDSGSLITIDAGSGTIDGETESLLVSQYDSKTLICNGSNWYIISQYIVPRADISWLTHLGAVTSFDSNAGDDICKDVAVDGLRNVYCAGYTDGAIGEAASAGADAFVMKFDSDGAKVWLTHLGDVTSENSNAGNDYCNGVTVDGSGNVYCAGYTDGAIGEAASAGDDAFVLKLDSNGNLVWLTHLGAVTSDHSNSGNDLCSDVAVDGSGNVYCAGYTDGAIGENASAGDDAFVMKLASDGVMVWLTHLGAYTSDNDNSGNDYCNGVAVDGFGSVYCAGETDGALGETNGGNRDAFIMKLRQIE